MLYAVALLIASILEGGRADDLPVELPTTFDLALTP